MVFRDAGLSYMVFSFFETKLCISHLMISDERFMALDRNPLGFFKYEHTKRLGGFTQIGILVKANWVDHFQGFTRKTLM
jgi:hypothetical protein